MTIAFFDIQRVRHTPAVYENQLAVLDAQIQAEADAAARVSLCFLRGHVYGLMERYSEAEADYLQLADWLLATEGPASPNYAGVLLQLSDCWRIMENYEKAQDAVERVLGVLSHAPNDERYLRALLQRARLYGLQDEPARAQVLLQQLIAMVETAPGVSRTLKVEAEIGLALASWSEDRLAAVARLQSILALCEAEELLPFCLRIHYELAELYLRNGEPDAAMAENRTAMSLIRGIYAETSRPYLQLGVQEAHIEAVLNDEEAATRHYRQVLDRAFDKMGDGSFVMPARAKPPESE